MVVVHLLFSGLSGFAVHDTDFVQFGQPLFVEFQEGVLGLGSASSQPQTVKKKKDGHINVRNCWIGRALGKILWVTSDCGVRFTVH